MKKLYVLSRKDIGVVYASVQAGHAVAQWLLDHPEQEWNNEYLIYLEVKDIHELNRFRMRINMREDNMSTFYEPDIGNQMTAIACYTDSNIFKNLKLLGSS